MKRPRGTGSVYLRGTLYWLKYYRNGIAVREPSGTDSIKQAQKLLQQRQGEVAANNYIEPSNRKVTIDQLFQALVDHYRVNDKSSAAETEARWQRPAKDGEPLPEAGRLKKRFSGMKAIALTTPKINQYIKWCQQEQGLANATINRDLAALRRAFTLAEEAKTIQTVPHFPILKESKPRQGFLEYSDYLKLREHATELWLRTIVVCLGMGMRLGEIVGGFRKKFTDGMRVRHVDLLTRNIRLIETKNGDDRIVPMTQELYTLMVACCAGKGPNDWVFTHEDGTQVMDFRKRWKRLLREAGVRGDLLRHDNRRSAARNLRRAGVPEGVIMKIGGWKTRSVFDRYAIVDEDVLAEAAERFDAAKQDWAQKEDWAQFGHNSRELHQKRAPVNITKVDIKRADSIKYN